MRITKLVLEKFRNYQNLELNFDPDEHITSIVGPNALGKTNILESIYLLALTKSFRTTKQQDMIGWESEYARVKGVFEMEDGADSVGLEAFLGKPPHPQKSFKKNGVKISAANFIGSCQVVFFHPEDLNMLYLGPDLRRAYLNIMNVQVSRKYFGALRAYQKVLKQRNALLHKLKDQRNSGSGNIDLSELDIWDEELVRHGSYLMLERSRTVEFFQERLSETYRKISRGNENVQIIYHHTLDFYNAPDDPAATNQTKSAKIWKEHFAGNLASARARDLQALVTTVGPHRDDLEFSFNGLRLSAHASRGEYRSLLLALKLIELEFFEERTGQNPILLLDDVFSELDPERQDLLMEAIQGHQTIVTTTHIDEPVRRHRNIHARELDARKFFQEVTP